MSLLDYVPSPRPSRRPVLGSALSLALIAALSACSPAPPPAQGPAEVVVMPVTVESMDVQQSLSGRTVATQVSDVRPQVGGIVQARLFTEGAEVTAGQVLYRIDARTYQAAYANAKAELAQAEAAVLSSRPKAARYRNLLEADAISQQDADEAQATFRANEAAVLAARAALESAQINLDFTRVTAPISGRIGTSAFTPGALVSAGQDAALATIQQLDPIHVDVTQTSAQLLELRQKLAAGTLKAVDGKAKVEIILEDGTTYPHAGTLEFIGTSVDTGTGSVTLRAVVPNPERLLLPGTYVQARLPMAINDSAILVPQTAVTRNTKGEAVVMLVSGDGKVTERVIQTATATKDQWVVSSGLKAGEQLIIEGASKVAAGQAVKIVIKKAPTSTVSPRTASAPANAGTAQQD